MTLTLKPCPFCGGEAKFENTGGPGVDLTSWTVGCNERDKDDNSVICYGYQSLTTFPTKQMAADAWNRRASACPPPEGKVDKRLMEFIEEASKRWGNWPVHWDREYKDWSAGNFLAAILPHISGLSVTRAPSREIPTQTDIREKGTEL